MTVYITSNGLVWFATYLVSSLILLALFTRIYVVITPYSEFEQIKAGKIAPAISLGGAMLGFTLPLLSMSFYGINFIDFLIWSIIACLIQLAAFKFLYRLMPMQIETDNRAIAIVYFFTSICVGSMNAFSLIPR
jgi:putative membrane protein